MTGDGIAGGVGYPRGLLELRVSLLLSGSLRERSRRLWIKRVHQPPRIRMSARYIPIQFMVADAPLQELRASRWLLSKGTAKARPRNARRAKKIKDLKVMVIVSSEMKERESSWLSGRGLGLEKREKRKRGIEKRTGKREACLVGYLSMRHSRTSGQ